MLANEFIVNSDSTFGEAINWVNGFYQDKKWVRLTANCGRRRTPSQNNAIHKYCRMIAEELNAKGFQASINSPILNSPIEVDWTMDMVKELWHTVQKHMYPDKEVSTSALERAEVSAVYEVMNRAMIEKTDGQVCLPFPSNDA